MTAFLTRWIIVPFAMTAALPQPCLAGPDAGTGGACTLLMGGGGTMTPDNDTNARWISLDSDLSHAVSDLLAKKGYHMSDFIVYLPDPKLRAQALEQTLFKTGCGQLLQITFDLPEHTSGSEAPQSGFAVTVAQLEQAAGAGGSRSIRIIEKYNVEYEYVPGRPKPTLADLARDVADDVAKANVLAK